MQQSNQKFLQFNGKSIYFKAVDGEWWIAIKPICDALSVNYNRQFQNIKNTKFFSELFAIQQMVGADGKVRQMVCLPEWIIYTWILKIDSEVPGFDDYQKECALVLHNHFKGAITGRSTELKKKTKAELEREAILNRFTDSEEGRRLKELESEIRGAKKTLHQLDEEVVKVQLPLWESETAEN